MTLRIGFGSLRLRWSHPDARSVARRMGAAFIVFSMATSGLLIFGEPASAAIVDTVDLGTSEDFSVLAGSAVTNTGTSAFVDSVGVWAGTAITGVTQAMIDAPGTIEAGTSVAQDAQSDLTSAYADAAGRTVDFTTPTAQLGGLLLIGGVYAAPAKAALGLTGILTLDGGGDPDSVFIFQTDGALDTAAASQIQLINGALECNVFWQVGGSATLGASSTFVGSILAQTAITVGAGVQFHGHALARDAAVTLDSDTFSEPTCAAVEPTTTTFEPTTTTILEATTTTFEPTTTTMEPTTTTFEPTTTTFEPTTTTFEPTTTTFEPTTTTFEPTTTTLEATTTFEATTTTMEPTTTFEPTTTPGPTTASSVQSEGVTVTALAAVSAVAARNPVAPSALPFTGLSSHAILLLAASIFGLGCITLFVSREEEK